MAEDRDDPSPCYAEWVNRMWDEADALDAAGRREDAIRVRLRAMAMVRDGAPCRPNLPCFNHCALTRERFPWADDGRTEDGDPESDGGA